MLDLSFDQFASFEGLLVENQRLGLGKEFGKFDEGLVFYVLSDHQDFQQNSQDEVFAQSVSDLVSLCFVDEMAELDVVEF